ncbi:MAG: hypothetical protein ACE366_00675 [Bradymonadia bacterium]
MKYTITCMLVALTTTLGCTESNDDTAAEAVQARPDASVDAAVDIGADEGAPEEAPDMEPEPPEEIQGVKMLYMGHSFGRPFAEQLTDFTEAMGIEGHQQEIAFAGGANGPPQALWEHEGRRAQIQAILDGGDIEVLTMICCSESFLESGEEWAVRSWMDYALAQNPDTRFALAMPWLDFPESYPSVTEYYRVWSQLATVWLSLIDDLRAEYPGVEIFPIPHGGTAMVLRSRFENDALPEVDVLTSRETNAIFTDEKGHANQILRDVGTLVWLGAVYDVDVSEYTFDPPYETDLGAIAAEVLETNGIAE